MNIEALQGMDEQADKAIAKWSFAALAANVLPPPFDLVAVGVVFGGMGKRLASIYGVEMNKTVLRDLAVAIATGTGTVLAGYYVGTGLMKYIPGVNFWIALLAQPPVVGALAYASGHTFKQYYHAILTENRYLTTDEVKAIVKKVLEEKLSALRDSGYRFRSHASSDSTPRPQLEILPYADRQLIVLADRFRKTGFVAGQILELGGKLSPIRLVARDEVARLSFTVGHPRNNIIYVGHPLIATTYYSAAEFHRRLFEHKVAEVSGMLRSLGATYIKIERMEGYTTGRDFHATVGALSQNVSGEAGYNRDSSSSIAFEARYDPPAASPRLPEKMAWYQHEDLWREIADGRMNQGTRDFRLDIVYKDDFGVSANLGRSIELLKLKLDLGGSFTEYQQTTWHVSGAFGEIENVVEREVRKA